MRKYFVKKIENATVDNFTSKFGLKMRRIFHRLISGTFNIVVRFYYRKKIIVDKRVKLKKDKCYIFASNHSFYLDGSAVLSTVDRNCYVLFGATEQLYFDLCTLFVWISGLVYIDRFNKQSRIDSVTKMNKVLQAGNSLLIFPEARWNDSENLLCQKLFAGPYNLSLENKVEVVPVSVYNDTYGKNIYISYGKPLKLYNYDKDKGLELLRDSLATMYYEQIVKHSEKYDRKKVKKDIHFDYMDERMYEYSKAKFRSNYKWDDELFTYKGKDVDLEDVWKDIDKVNININNIDKFKDILIELKRKKKYNFVDYMNKNYRKKY